MFYCTHKIRFQLMQLIVFIVLFFIFNLHDVMSTPQSITSNIPVGIQCLKQAYPEKIKKIQRTKRGGVLIFTDKQSISWDNKSYEYLLNPVTKQQWKEAKKLKITPWKTHSYQDILKENNLLTMMYQRYPAFHSIPHSIPINFEPGRVRHEEFFKIIYGASAKEVSRHLDKIEWFNGQVLKVHKKAYASLLKIKNALKKLPKKFHKFFVKSSGTYYWRYIKGSKRLSMHSFGIAIDIAVRHAHYWKWTRKVKKLKLNETIPYQNNFPQKIIDIFELNHWIWGGRWYHHDTMHFEYRPELFQPACVDYNQDIPSDTH
jgi:hypothetical protein